jgi:hypothetical protein
MHADPERNNAGACSSPAPRPKRPLTERQREALRRVAFKKGHDPRRNLTENQTTKARSRIEALINANAEGMIEVLSSSRRPAMYRRSSS